MKYSHKKWLFSYVATLFQFVVHFARVGILNSRPGGSREVLVSDSECFVGFCGNFLVGIFLVGIFMVLVHS